MNRPSPGWYATLLSLTGLLLAPPLAAGESGPASGRRTNDGHVTQGHVAKTVDIALDADGRLSGQVVTTSGEPSADAKLRLVYRGDEVAQTTADATGKFQFRLARGGTYEIATGTEMTSIRVWTARAAPPGCAKKLIFVTGNTLRGQTGRIPYTQMNPWLVAGVVAVAVAIPVVLANNRSDRGDGS